MNEAGTLSENDIDEILLFCKMFSKLSQENRSLVNFYLYTLAEKEGIAHDPGSQTQCR